MCKKKGVLWGVVLKTIKKTKQIILLDRII